MELVTITEPDFIHSKVTSYPATYVIWDKDFNIKTYGDLLSIHFDGQELYLKFQIKPIEFSKIKSKKLYFAIKHKAFSFLGMVVEVGIDFVVVKVNKCVIEEQRLKKRIDLYKKSYFGVYQSETSGNREFNFKINDISETGISFITNKEFTYMIFDEENHTKNLFLKSIQNDEFSEKVELVPVYSKILYAENNVAIYKLGARFLRTSQDIKLFVNKLNH